MKQKIITPEIKKCCCGSKANLVWMDYDNWQVHCIENDHRITPEMGSGHRAVCRWNNTIEKIDKFVKFLKINNIVCEHDFHGIHINIPFSLIHVFGNIFNKYLSDKDNETICYLNNEYISIEISDILDDLKLTKSTLKKLLK